MPSSLKYIGNAAFNGCGLKKIEFPPSLEYIGSFAFCSCRSLETVVLPDREKLFIGNAAFSDCKSLKDVIIPGKVKNIEREDDNGKNYPHEFEDCSSLSLKSKVALRKFGFF